MTSTQDEGFDIDFSSSEVIDCPYPFFERARARGRVVQLGDQALYFVPGHDDVLFAAHHPELFSSHRPSLGAGDPEFEAIAAEGYPDAQTLVTNDPPEHTGYRKLVNRRFGARVIAGMEPTLRTLADELIDGFIDRGEVDFLTEFAMPLPCRVMGELFGAPAEDQANFHRWAMAIADSVSRFVTRERALECKRSIVEMQHYFAGLIEERRANPGDDLISELVLARHEGIRPLEVPEMLELLRIILAGGVETTASVISTAMFLLLRHPAQLADVQADHALIPRMIEEAMRLEAPSQWNPRTIERGDVTLGDVTLPVGARVLLGWASANHDPAHYGDDADAFDIHRTVTDHLSFGHGAHFCLGAFLGRAEARIAFEQFLSRTSDLELAAPVESLHFTGGFIRRLDSVPVRFRRR